MNKVNSTANSNNTSEDNIRFVDSGIEALLSHSTLAPQRNATSEGMPTHWSHYPNHQTLSKKYYNAPHIKRDLGPLFNLLGTWRSSPQNGYSVMPIPCPNSNSGYSLFTFFYYEELTFSIIVEKNRRDTGHSYTLFYEQNIFYSDGPHKDQLAHNEKGAFLHVIPDSPMHTDSHASTAIVKQIAAANGNSIFTDGTYKTHQGSPEIQDACALPLSAPYAARLIYGPDTPYNPNINPNIVLQGALSLTPDKIDNTTVIDLQSKHFDTAITMTYMQKSLAISALQQQLWIESFSSGIFQMQYSQNVTLNYVNNTTRERHTFPYINANTLQKII